MLRMQVVIYTQRLHAKILRLCCSHVIHPICCVGRGQPVIGGDTELLFFLFFFPYKNCC